jgi:hypothetical protein
MLMNRRDFFKSSAALTLCSTVLGTEACSRSPLVSGTDNGTNNGTDNGSNNGTVKGTLSVQVKTPASVYDRALHFVYAGSGSLFFPQYSDDYLLEEVFAQVPGGLTMLNPFFLNVKNPGQYASILQKLKDKGISVMPGIGNTADGTNSLNDPNNLAAADAYINYTDCIRLENTQGYYDTKGADDIQRIIDYCVLKGYKHIELNPWPMAPGNAYPIPFQNLQLDSTFQQVGNSKGNPTGLVNQTLVGKIQAYRPSIGVLVNYESAPQHQALADMEAQAPGSSIALLDLTASQCETSSNNLNFAFPFTHVYDPVELGTWDWMASRVGNMPGSVNLQISMSMIKTGSGYEVTLTVTNTGIRGAANVTVKAATLGTAVGATLPASLGTLLQNQSASVTLVFPSSAGASKAAATLQISGLMGINSDGTFSGTLNTTLP